MKRSDYIRALVASFLTLDANKAEEIAKRFLPSYNLLTPGAPNCVSIGAKDQKGTLSSFVDWCKSLQARPPKAYRFFSAEHSIGNLPKHIVEAFETGDHGTLLVDRGGLVSTYSIRTQHSSHFKLTPVDFVALMDAQVKPNLVWDRIVHLVRESHELNGEPPVEPNRIREFFVAPEQEGFFSLMAEQLVEEAQIECVISDIEFRLPENLVHAFEKMDSSFYEDDPFYVYLYPLRIVKIPELIQLIEAQASLELLPIALEQEAEQTSAEDLLKPGTTDWKAWLQTKTNEDLENTGIVNLVCRAICRICEEIRKAPVIPAPLKDAFGPDELDQKRAQHRSNYSSCPWVLAPNDEPWELYFLHPTGEFKESLPPINLEAHKKNFLAALRTIEDFAFSRKSPYAEAFKLARFCLEGNILKGGLDAAHLDRIREQFKNEGFSPRAFEIFEENAFVVKNLILLDKPFEWLVQLMACSIADVFGGMGSWNDQDFGDEYSEYQEVSVHLHQALREQWAALLSS